MRWRCLYIQCCEKTKRLGDDEVACNQALEIGQLSILVINPTPSSIRANPYHTYRQRHVLGESEAAISLLYLSIYLSTGMLLFHVPVFMLGSLNCRIISFSIARFRPFFSRHPNQEQNAAQ